MTRAFNALFHLKFAEAYQYNPRIYIVSTIMLVAWIWLIKTDITKNYIKGTKRKETENGKET